VLCNLYTGSRHSVRFFFFVDPLCVIPVANENGVFWFALVDSCEEHLSRAMRFLMANIFCETANFANSGTNRLMARIMCAFQNKHFSKRGAAQIEIGILVLASNIQHM
jgi:hypothetical protein